MKVYKTRTVRHRRFANQDSPLFLDFCSLVAKLSSDKIRGPTSSGKVLNRILMRSFLSFLRKTCVASVTQRLLFPGSFQGLRYERLGPCLPFCVFDTKKKDGLQIRSLAARQARLIKHFISRLFRQRNDYYSQAVSKISARNAWDHVFPFVCLIQRKKTACR